MTRRCWICGADLTDAVARYPGPACSSCPTKKYPRTPTPNADKKAGKRSRARAGVMPGIGERFSEPED